MPATGTEPEQKAAIAARAGHLLRDDMIVYLDAGTTTGAMVPVIRAFADITIITNDFAIVDALTGPETFTYLVKNIDVTQANTITEKFPMIGAERVDIREYPGGALAANMVGATSSGDDGKLVGLQGLEAGLNDELDGVDGEQTFDKAQDNTMIPGTLRNVTAPRDGDTVHLTVDSDLQWRVQRAIQSAKDKVCQKINDKITDAVGTAQGTINEFSSGLTDELSSVLDNGWSGLKL